MIKTKVTYFKSTPSTAVAGQVSVEEVLQKIRNGEWAESIDKLRKGDETIKQALPVVAMHGLFEFERKKSDFYEASGLVILDLDDVDADELEETKEDIFSSSEHILAVMISPSGNGIKILYYVNPDLVTADNYRQIGKEIVQNFKVYGDVDYLSITDCLIVTHDSNILINPNPTPAFIYIPDSIKIKGELEARDHSKPLYESAEDFFDTVLADNIAEKTNNNFHYIQVAVLDMAKFGFKHPQEDLSFIIDYAESNFKSSSSNKQRFLEVAELAKNYPQTAWPYKLFRGDEEDDDEYIDYSQYQIPDKSIEIEDREGTGNEPQGLLRREDEESFDGLIDYDSLLERVLETAREGDRVGYEIALKNFSEVMRFKGTGIITVTGIPGHGKTEFIDAITLDLARLFGQKTLIAGFEQSPEEHIIKLIRKMIGVDVTCPSWLHGKNEEIFKENYNFIIEHFKHLDVNKVGGNINDILEHASKLILKMRMNGEDPKYIVLDPFNMISLKGKFTGHEKIEEILRRITQFSHQMKVLVFLVAHPFKMRVDEKTGQYFVPDFYSVKGSSAFFEMSYHGFVVYRNPDGSVLVKILKVKQNNLGVTGAEVLFTYHKASGRYYPIDEEGNELSGDHTSKEWLHQVVKNNNKSLVE